MKIVTDKQLQEHIQQLKAKDAVVVFTTGCFDILHAGHVRYLAAARSLGDCLIVGLNSDESVRSLKGSLRPVNHEQDRAEVLAALAAVDYVVMFADRTAERLISELQPDIYVKGGDYCLENLPEAKIVASYGGKTVLIPEVPGRSTSTIIRRISEQENAKEFFHDLS